MKNNFKRFLAMFLAVMMIVGVCAFPVSATPTVDQPDACEEHEWKFEKNVKATCTTQGYDLYYCPVCYRYEQRNVTDKTDHVWEQKGEVKPTCAADGHPAGEVCKNCGTFNGTISAEYEKLTTCGANCDPDNNDHAMDATCIHTWGDPTSEGNPCLDPNVSITYECEYCDAKHVESSTAGKHTYAYDDSTLVEPTCKTAGSINRVCSLCKDTQTVVIEKIAHDYKITSAGSSETNCGQTCNICGESSVSATAHTFKVVTTPAKCEVAGSTVSTCTCGYVKTEVLKALEHEESKVVKVKVELVHTQTELVDEVTIFHCDRCDQDWEKVTEKAQHTPYSEVEEIAPTCTFDGAKIGRCTCGILTTVVLDATGHTADTSIAPDTSNYSCDEGGYYVYTCKCGEKFNGEELDPGKHDWKKVTVPAKCGVDGYEREECNLCDAVQNETVLPMPQDHKVKELYKYGQGCVDPIVVYTFCENAGCQYNFTTDISAYTHKETVGILETALKNGEVWRDVTEARGSHSMSAETIIIESNCIETGWMGYKCEDCDLMIKTHPLVNLNVDNHVGAQTMTDFRWSCSANAGEQLYSTWYCESCQTSYDRRTEIPKEGLSIAVGTNGLNSITLYVEGAVKAQPSALEILAADIADATFVKNAEGKEVIQSGTSHVFKETKTPDCKTEGEKTCVICTATAKIPTTTAHEAGTKIEVTPSSCTVKGTWESTCKVCGEELTGEFDLDPHVAVDDAEFKHLAAAATCTANAKYYQICSVCKGKLTTTFEKADTMLEHVYDKEVVKDEYKAPTKVSCIQQQKYYKTCACGAIGTETFVSGDFGACVKETASGHKAADDKVCVEYSYSAKEYCAVCDTVYTWTDFVAATGHEKNDGTKVSPTCIMLAYTYYTCKHCGEFADANGDYFWDIVIDEESKNAPHVNQYGEELTGNCKFEATDGDYECKVCHKEITPDQHSFGEETTACGVTSKTCAICGDVVSTGTAAHTFVKDEEASVEATPEADGKLVEVCSVCGAKKETVISRGITFGLKVENPYGDVLVTGGKAYVTITMDCISVDVNNAFINLTVDNTVLDLVGVVAGDYALGGDVMANQSGSKVFVIADANSEQKNVTLTGAQVLCVLEFDILYAGQENSAGAIDNDLKKSAVSFDVAAANSVINYDEEDVAFDVTAKKTTEFTIDQIADANDDGVVNNVDALLVRKGIEKTLEDATYYDAVLDINKDGKLTTADYALVKQYIVAIKTYTDLVLNK